MSIIGKVEIILNEDFLLVSSSVGIRENTVLKVLSTISNPKLKDTLGLEQVYCPKGEIVVVSKQKEGIFLAKRFKEFKQEKKVVTIPNPFKKQVFGMALNFEDEKREITETVPGPWSASFSLEDALNVEFEMQIKPGDLVEN